MAWNIATWEAVRISLYYLDAYQRCPMHLLKCLYCMGLLPRWSPGSRFPAMRKLWRESFARNLLFSTRHVHVMHSPSHVHRRTPSLPNAMQSKKLVEEIHDARLGAVTDQFIRPEPIDLISSKAQFAVGRHHVGIDLQ